jgi:TRAP transporter TAXI family solute receptor
MRRLILAMVAICASMAVACGSQAAPVNVTRIRVAGGAPDGTYSLIAAGLSSIFANYVPNVSAASIHTNGGSDNLDLVETGQAECGLGSADLVYAARVRGTNQTPQPHTHLRGVAVLFPQTVHVTTRAGSGLTRLRDLAGKRLAAGLTGDASVSGRGFRLDGIAAAIAAVSPRHTRPETLVLRMDDAVDQLGRGDIDAAHFYGGHPFTPVTQAAERYGIHLIEFDDLALSIVKETYPFSKAVIIPAGTYPGQVNAVRTIGIDNVLFCHSDLPVDLVYRLTVTLFDKLEHIASVHTSARQINPATAPATPIPLHEGAARYYRERELFR